MAEKSLDFIREIITEDLENNKHDGWVITRFPPEPNGYLHIGHAKSICLNFGIALENKKSRCHLRFDDTNPEKEKLEYIESIKEDVHWLGFDWGEHLYYASDYFDQLYEYACRLIIKGKAFVCSMTFEEINAARGTLTETGKESPDRNRPAEENLDLFTRMKAGEFEDGTYTLRAKVGMDSGNFHMRDPILYRIKRAHHHRTGDKWCIYPTYDYTHCLSDAIEEITHSLCTLEFEDHRPIYDWILDEVETPCHPQQIEFARLNLNYTVLSKRLLLQLVNEGVVAGWDDPRMPTISGFRRRGYTPESIRDFCDRIGIAKRNSIVDMALLEHCIREDLNKHSPRVMAVLDPLKVVIENYPEEQVEELDAINNPEDEDAGTRKVPFSKVIYIEREDFMENPQKKFFRLSPGKEVRLRYAYFLKCESVIKDPKSGEVTELRCTYDPATKGGNAPDGRKVKATLHWVSDAKAINAEVRLYDRLFTKENPMDVPDKGDFHVNINPESLVVLKNCKLEPSLANAKPGERFQFERKGYFCVDIKDSKAGAPVFNRTVTLRDTWARFQKGEARDK